MNCPDCSEPLAAGVFRCACGWSANVAPQPKIYRGPPVPIETPELISARSRAVAMAKKLSFSKQGTRDWAYRLMARHDAGEVLTPNQYQLASEAIRTDPARRV